MFVDKVNLIVKSGKGGDGVVSFRREKYVPKGGPSGGDGGRGGEVILKVDANINNLYHLRHTPVIKAGNGRNGRSKKMRGKNGEDVIITIPPGTTVYNGNGKLICDLLKPGEIKVIARGGKGGKGNYHFSSSTNRLPEFATKGEEGEEKKITLELKLIADVGIVGYPNVGKSTLLSNISSATPKIADYPFTTLSPNLGVVQYHDYTRITFADIPGVIKGASKGKGLGLEFLRHIERTKLLLIILDITSKTPHSDYSSIIQELSMYSPALAKYPKVVAVNKIDMIKGKFEKISLNAETVYISALKKTNLSNLLKTILSVYKNSGGNYDKK
jgi:GTP-binding protein